MSNSTVAGVLASDHGFNPPGAMPAEFSATGDAADDDTSAPLVASPLVSAMLAAAEHIDAPPANAAQIVSGDPAAFIDMFKAAGQTASVADTGVTSPDGSLALINSTVAAVLTSDHGFNPPGGMPAEFSTTGDAADHDTSAPLVASPLVSAMFTAVEHVDTPPPANAPHSADNDPAAFVDMFKAAGQTASAAGTG